MSGTPAPGAASRMEPTGSFIVSLFDWLGFIVSTLGALPAEYRSRLRRRPGRMVGLTALVAIVLVFPLLSHAVLEPFSRTVFPLPIPDDTIMTFMTIFAIMAVGLNIVAGFAGLLDLGYVAFYAIGAYVAAYLASPFLAAFGIHFVFLSPVASSEGGIHLPFGLVVPLAVVVVATFGALLGAPTLRLRGDYLAIVTLGFGEIVPLVFKNLSQVTASIHLGPINIDLASANLTGGVQGINPIDAPVLPLIGTKFDASSGFFPVYLGLAMLVLSVLVARNLERSRIGRAWIAIREDESAAEMMGINTVRTKLLAFALGASFAGIAGAFQASYIGATTSDFFDFNISILVLIMIILGGIGNIWGVIVGAFTLRYVNDTFLPWLGGQLQQYGLPNPAQYNFLFFGIILVLMMRFRPQGFLPSRQREAELSLEALAEAQAAGGSAPPIDPETGEIIGLDNIDIAPPGQDETGLQARAPEVPGEAREL